MLRTAAAKIAWVGRTASMVFGLALVMALVFGVASTAWAATYTVTNTNDSGEGSLRQAMIDANDTAGADTIAFAQSLSGPQTITLASQLPTITDPDGLTINGGNAEITISGNDQVLAFQVGSGTKLTLSNLTVAHGNSAYGGGILNVGTLTVSNSTLSDNSSQSGNGSTAYGGGIWNYGNATVSNSTLSGNSAQYGGGIFNNGFGSTLTVSNSTFSGNSAVYEAGGISNDGGTATLQNTIVANTTSGGNCAASEGSSVTNGGYNLDSGTSCGFGTENNSLSDVDPMLGALADNGGLTKTHALLVGSPAINAGNPETPGSDAQGACTASDQRGAPRLECDIGAYEMKKCYGAVVNVVGTPGPDVLRGAEGNDAIRALGGDDSIIGLGGEDSICSGEGNDTVSGGEGKDILRGGPGDDTLRGGPDDDRLNTTDGVQANDLADGGSGKDICKTDPEDERVRCP